MPDFKKVNEEIAEGVTGGFQKIEDSVVGGYKKIEGAVVDACKGVEDKFVGRFLTHEGETVEDAKARLAAEQTAREEQAKADAEKRAAEQKARIEASKHAGKQQNKSFSLRRIIGRRLKFSKKCSGMQKRKQNFNNSMVD